MRNFTPEELTHFKAELKKFQSPWLTKIVIHAWFSFGRYSIFPIFVLIFTGMILFQYIPAWQAILGAVLKWIGFTLIFGTGGLFLISHLLLEWKIKVTRKMLGLSKEEWNYLVELFQIQI